jgi:hypothetical protein
MTERLSNKPLPSLNKLSKVYKAGHRKDVKTATIAGILNQLWTWLVLRDVAPTLKEPTPTLILLLIDSIIKGPRP